MGKYLITFLSFLVALGAFGQSKRELLKQAEYALYDEDFLTTLRYYQQLEEKYPEEDSHLYFKYIAEHMTTKRGSDLSNLLAFEDTKGATDKYYNYWLGRIHLLRYELDDAKEHLNAFLKTKAYRSKQIENETQGLLTWIALAEVYYNNPDEYEIEQLPKGINTQYSEISPAFFAGHNELLFASNRPTAGKDASPTYTIFHTVKETDKWNDPTPVLSLGLFTYENAKIEVIEQDKRLYMFRPENNGDIFYSTFNDVTWTPPQEFDSKIRNKHIESHFFINDDENLIYFVSGASENLDIWQTIKVNDDWTNPRPVPGRVNSPYDEESPFLSHDGKYLYFSSNRPESIGGYDVFQSELDLASGKWQDPVNMGFPINTMDDDINFELTPSDQSGYLASNRLHTQGSFDIYYFHKEAKITIKGKVTTAGSGQPLAGAEIRFHPKSYQDESFNARTNNKGEYELKIFNRDRYDLEIVLQRTVIHTMDYESYVPTNALHLTKDITVKLPAELQESTDYASLYQGESEEQDVELEMIGSKFRAGHKAVLKNIYFDSESYRLKAESEPVLERIYTTLQKYPDLRVEIAGHTDNVGPAESNLTLSQRRAEAVREYLIKRGINPNRMFAKGYGESDPLASNDDEKDGRELNRRIEIIALD